MARKDKPATPVVPRSLPRRIARVVWKVTSRLVLTLVVLVAIGIGLLHTSWGRNKLRGVIQDKLAAATTTKVAIGGLDFSFDDGLTLQRITIDDTEGKPAIQVGRVQLAPHWRSLVGARPVIDLVAVDGVVLDLRVRADGTSNLTGVMKPQPPGGAPKPFALSALRVTNVEATITKFDGSRTHLTGLSLTGAASADPAHQSGSLHAEARVARVEIAASGIEADAVDITTFADAAFDRGAGTVHVGPTTATLTVRAPGRPPETDVVSLAAIDAVVAPGDVSVTATDLRAGPMSLKVATLHPRYQGLKLDGPQHAKLQGLVLSAEAVNRLLGRPVMAGDLTIDAALDGPPDKLAVQGTVATPGGTLTMGGDVSILTNAPRYALRLSSPAFGARQVALGPQVPDVTVGALDMKLDGSGPDLGHLDSTFAISLTGTSVRGVGIERVDIAGRFGQGKLDVPTFVVTSGGQSITSSMTVELGPDGRPSHVAVQSTTVASIAETLAVLRQAGIPVKPAPALRQVELAGPMTLRIEGDPAGKLVVTTDAMVVRLRGGGRIQAQGGATFGKGDVALGEPALKLESMHGDLSIDASLGALAKLGGGKRPPPPPGRLRGTVRFSGTPLAPIVDARLGATLADGTGGGTVTAAVRGRRLMAHAVMASTRGVYAALDLTGAPRGGSTALALRGDVRQTEDGPVLATITGDATLRGALARAAKAPLAWNVVIDAPQTVLASLPLPPKTLAALRPGATGAVNLRASGTRHDVAADLTVALDDLKELPRNGIGPIDVALATHLEAGRTHTSVVASVDGAALATVDATVGLGGKGLLDRLKTKAPLDPSLDVTVDVARRDVATLAGDPRAPGTIGGQLRVTGTAQAPQLDGTFTAEDLVALDGAPTQAAIVLSATRQAFKTTVTLADALTLGIAASPQAYLDALARPDGGDVAVDVSLDAAPTALDRLLPDLPALQPYRSGIGKLSSDLGATVTLHATKAGATLADAQLRGTLLVDGAKFAIPKSPRVLDGIALELQGDGDALRIARIEAHEHDLDKPDRNVLITGAYQLKARTADLAITTKDMLLAGGEMGEPDAPRATLTAAMDVHADLAPAIKQVDVTVRSLELHNPDRYPLSHQPEALSRGDVIELGGDVQVGQLQRAKPLAPPPVRGPKSLEVRVHIPEPIHVENRPLDLYATGEILMEQFGKVTALTGSLVGQGGDLRVSGNAFAFDHGAIVLGEALPRLDLHFKAPPPLVAQRDFATAHADVTEVHVLGPMGLQKLTLSGFADTLFDGLALTNGGRARVLSRPDAPGSYTAQLPQLRELQITGFVKGNLPYLAFLTRINTFADPTVNRFAYGRFEHLGAERFFHDGTRRFLLRQRPPTIGQSSGEVEVDHLWLNTRRSVAGVGVVAGTRVGGGLAVFWEWSSAE